MQRPSAPRPWHRHLCVALGCVCVGVGTVGIFLPGLPTTIFLLAASALFARSSPRLERWLDDQPRLGPFLRQARDGRMPVRARVASIVVVWAAIGVSFAAGGMRSQLCSVSLLAAGVVGTAAILVFGNRSGRRRAGHAGITPGVSTGNEPSGSRYATLRSTGAATRHL